MVRGGSIPRSCVLAKLLKREPQPMEKRRQAAAVQSLAARTRRSRLGNQAILGRTLNPARVNPRIAQIVSAGMSLLM